jgi:energy-coupling factor transporter ATP-binding protein EcfA2
VHSEEAVVVPTASWFPQVSEFAIDLAAASRRDLPVDQVPLSVDEAFTLALNWSAPAEAAATRDGPQPDERQATRLLSVKSLSFGYDRNTPILRGVDLEIQSNAIVALLGRNGSGKTTLARMLVGINAAPAGSIKLEGKDISRLGAREIASEIGYVFQNPDHQFVTDRVDEEIAYSLKVRDYSDEEIAARVDEVLEIVDLQRYRARSPYNLSLGERRRLSVATMLVLQPRMLVLDEPTIGQDHERAQLLMGLMARLRKRYGTTILMITHDVRLVAEWADRALVLRSGRIAFDGRPIDLFADDELLGSTGLLAPPIHELSRRLAAQDPERGLRPVLSSRDLVTALAASPRMAMK